jgi:hypothetical protein
MRLFVLRPRKEVLGRPSHPWAPPWDKVFGIVVRAANETDARALAQGQAGSEGLGVYRRLGCREEGVAALVWLDSTFTQCEDLAMEGKAAVILVDRREG